MQAFNYQNGILYAENIPLTTIAKQFGTPVYVYSANKIRERFKAYANNMPSWGHVCYAVKANSNLAILQLLAKMGAGFDIVSSGELARVLTAGGLPQKIIFSGVGKTAQEMQEALQAGIACFNLESYPEAVLLNQVAQSLNVIAKVAIRVNPDVDAGSHPYIATGLNSNKFGIEINSAVDFYLGFRQFSHLQIIGVDCHIGSQLTEISPFLAALERVLVLIDKLYQNGINLQHLDLGGGLGVRYIAENPPAISDYLNAVLAKLKGRNLKLIVEPGRSIVAEAGVLLTQVLYLKTNVSKNFAIVDAAMNDLIRPALYQAQMPIWQISQSTTESPTSYDVVGPVCETGDFLAQNYPLDIKSGDLLAIGGAGAYGFGMASNYNSRPRVSEVLVDGDKCHLIRERESVGDLFAHENLI